MRTHSTNPLVALALLAVLLGCGDRTIDRLRGDAESVAVVGR